MFFLMQSFASAAIEDAICNEHYIYDGLKFDELSPERAEYVQGDNATIDYAITNNFGSPLVEGAFWPVVMYWGQDLSNRAEDGDVVESLSNAPIVNIQKGDKYSGSFTWKIPKDAKPGYYVVNVYFVEDRKFDVSGLSFMTSVPAKKTSFKVTGTDSGVFMLDKASTTLNGEKYGFRVPTPEVKPNAPIEIKTKLVNPNNQKVGVYYELFSWNTLDTSNGGLMDYSKDETVSDSRELTYSMPSLPVGVYVAKISAFSGEWRSVIYVRFFVKGSKAGFVWAGLDHFPLMKDDKTTLAFCFTNLASEPGNSDIKTPAKIVVRVSDDSGNMIAEETYQSPGVVAALEGKKISFTSPGQYTKLKVKAEMYDDKGVLMDDAELVYDYTKFLNIEKRFTLTAPEKAVDYASYAVEYTDRYADPLTGDLVVYLSAPDGKVVSMKEEKISGKLSGEFSLVGLADGAYTIKAIEKKESLTDKKTVVVSRPKEITSTSTTVEEVATTQREVTTTTLAADKVQSLPWGVIAVVAVVLIILLILLRGRSKGAKK